MKSRNKEVIDGIREKDSMVLNSFHARSMPFVRRMIRNNRGVEEDVEDVMQEAMIFLYEKVKIADLDLTSSIDNYFYGICRNMWKNRLKKQQMIYYLDQIPEVNNHNCIITRRMEKEHRKTVFKTHFDKLNRTSKKILELSFEGKKIREIAKDLKCTEGAIRKRKFDAKNSLISSLQKDRQYLELIA